MASEPDGRAWRAGVGCLVALLAATAALSGATTAAGAGESTLAVGDAAVDPDERASVAVALDAAPDGLSGFEVRLRLADGDVGRVTSASYPDHFQPTTEPEVGSDGRSVRVKAADLDGEVEPGAANVTLATVTVAGSAEGETAVTVESARIDGDGGGALDPSIDAGTVVVGDGDGSTAAGESGSGGAAVSPDGSTGGASGDGGPLGVPTAVVVGLAVLAVVGLVARRAA
ncbi:cell surface protein [Halomicrobium salinisoli]|uniref:cell surface protein n=1 Tax=Halomicrobium salinisoli TaxID=2878391 RepID=UPI001CF0B0F8|nr:cell surface protein [Halomicrobium salinisoli]